MISVIRMSSANWKAALESPVECTFTEVATTIYGLCRGMNTHSI